MPIPDDQRNEDEAALQAPAKLVDSLKRLHEPQLFIPATLDEAIVRAARQRLEKNRRPAPWLRFLPWVAAATTAIVLVIAMPRFVAKPGNSFAKEDLNLDGRVDILDAFALATKLKAGAIASPQLDLNGDGVVDSRDVAVLAAQAVSLRKGGRS
jgi:hypothetical protein